MPTEVTPKQKKIIYGIIGLVIVIVIGVALVSSNSNDVPTESTEEARIAQLEKLPDSCHGVDSIDTELYPTGEQCLKAIRDRIYEYCLSTDTKPTEQGSEARAQTCKSYIIQKLESQCKNSNNQGAFSTPYDVCVMVNLEWAYQTFIPK